MLSYASHWYEQNSESGGQALESNGCDFVIKKQNCIDERLYTWTLITESHFLK